MRLPAQSSVSESGVERQNETDHTRVEGSPYDGEDISRRLSLRNTAVSVRSL
jgi:hypothetical protein